MSVISAGGDTLSLRFKSALRDDFEWNGVTVNAPDYEGPLPEAAGALWCMSSLGLLGEKKHDTYISDDPYVVSSMGRRWCTLLRELDGPSSMWREVQRIGSEVVLLAMSVPDMEFDHSNKNYPNAINLLPDQKMPLDIKIDLLQEHVEWQHTAPGDLSLERCRKMRSNYLLLKRIVDSHKK